LFCAARHALVSVYFIGSAQHSCFKSLLQYSQSRAEKKWDIYIFLLHAESELKAPSIIWEKRYFRNELAYS
jgi:hypothetical protein